MVYVAPVVAPTIVEPPDFTNDQLSIAAKFATYKTLFAV
jgi:hypothetical protein